MKDISTYRARRFGGSALPHVCLLLLGLALMSGWASLSVAQDRSIRAYVDNTTVSTNETVTYTIEVSGNSLSGVRTPEAPQATGLALAQSIPNRSSRISYRNGQMQQRITFTWTYRPQRPGAASIEGTAVEVEGRTYHTDPIRLRITGAPRGGRQRSNPSSDDDDPPDFSSSDIFIRATPNSQRVYRNEQATITYRLFYRPQLRVRKSRMAGSWDAQGFWREDLDVDSRPVPETIVHNGVRYKSIELKRSAVFPARAGTLRVDPLRIETEVQTPRNSRGLFDRFFSLGSDLKEIELSSPPVPIIVRPLPAGAPDEFQGAVGAFQMMAHVDHSEVDVGEPITVRIRLGGTGNLSTLSPPAFSVPESFDAYDPEVSTTIERDGQRLRGHKTFEHVLVPQENGRFELPSLRFAYFDPDAETYKTLTTELPALRVTGSAERPSASTSSSAALPANDIAGLMTTPTRWRRPSRTPLHRSPWTYAALGVPLLVTLGVFAYQRRNARLAQQPALRRRRKARPSARKQLAEAENLLDAADQRAFFAALQRAVLTFIGHRFNVSAQALTRSELDQHLADADVPGRLRRATRTLLDKTDQARFAPGTLNRTSREAALKRARKLIDALDAPFSDRPAS